MGNRVFCIGELLIDMICVDNKGLKDGEKFEKKLAGHLLMLLQVLAN